MEARSNAYRTNGSAALAKQDCVVLRFPESERKHCSGFSSTGESSTSFPEGRRASRTVRSRAGNLYVVDESVGAEIRDRIARESSLRYQAKHGTLAGHDDGVSARQIFSMSAFFTAFMCIVALL